MPKKNTAKLLQILFILNLPNCTSVEIIDSEWCGDLGKEGALCTYTFSEVKADRELGYVEWEKERYGMVCTNPESFSNWKRSLLKLCEKTGKCVFVGTDD